MIFTSAEKRRYEVVRELYCFALKFKIYREGVAIEKPHAREAVWREPVSFLHAAVKRNASKLRR